MDLMPQWGWDGFLQQTLGNMRISELENITRLCVSCNTICPFTDNMEMSITQEWHLKGEDEQSGSWFLLKTVLTVSTLNHQQILIYHENILIQVYLLKNVCFSMYPDNNLKFNIIKLVFNSKSITVITETCGTHVKQPKWLIYFLWPCSSPKELLQKSTALPHTCIMVPTESLECQLYGRVCAKAITKSLHCFTHFFWLLDGS